MSDLTPLAYRSGVAFRVQTQAFRAVIGCSSGALIALYLLELLELAREQWIFLAIAVAVFTLLSGVGLQALLMRVDRTIMKLIDAEVAGETPPREIVREAFRTAVRYPIHGLVYTVSTWASAGILVPIALHLRFPDLPLEVGLSILVAALVGGSLATLFTFFADKRMAAPLRDRWAGLIRDPQERRALIRPLSLGTKLRAAVTAIVLVIVVVAVLLSDLLSQRPIEGYATRIQSGWLLRMAERVDGPGDPVLKLARTDLEELGIGADVVVVEVATRRVVDGAPDALTPAELEWIEKGGRGGDAGRTSMGLSSPHAFAWRSLEGDTAHALVTVVDRSVLTGDLTAGRMLFASLALLAAVLGLATAHFLARDVSDTTRRLRHLADRIASGDLTQAEPIESEDELGDLAHAFERMSGSLRATVGRVTEAADGVVAAAAEMAQVGTAVTTATVDQSRSVERARESVGAINREVGGITDSAQTLSAHVEEAGSSVLELGAAGEELKQTAATMNEQVDGVTASIEQMIASVRQISDNTESLGGAATDTSTSMSEIAASMRDVDSHAAETARLSAQVVSLAERGRERVAQTIAGMDAIREATTTVETVISGLGSRVKEIGAIVDVIDDVADETNLLALNAAIIAAQAGDQGKAFSVVADEIAELADRVLTSTKEIGGLIRAVQTESLNAAEAIERGAHSVQQGVGLAAEAGRSLDEINTAARTSGTRIGEIVQAVREQSRAALHVADLVERVSSGVGEIREAGRAQNQGNQGVLRGAGTMRDVAQQVLRTTAEQARGSTQIRESMERVRDAVERIHASLRQQSDSSRRAVTNLEQIHERTRSNEEATQRMSEATVALKTQAEALRQDVRRFRI
ncbi:MAG TPA: HAMP domain-containing methyl-accepting chemotaxis protein [Myxococcota bacterium]|nr:HAMP domain-containing methyl-accepting chemotaxis protein [Myxococcota bacterium]